MNNQIEKPIIRVNGKVIDPSKCDYLFDKENKKTIVDQTNPLLERAKKIIIQTSDKKIYPRNNLITFSVNFNKY